MRIITSDNIKINKYINRNNIKINRNNINKSQKIQIRKNNINFNLKTSSGSNIINKVEVLLFQFLSKQKRNYNKDN